MPDYNPDHGTALYEESATSLIGGLLGDAKDLAAAHAEQIRNEVRTELDSIKGAMARTAVALAGAVIAGVVLAHACALALSAATGLPTWAGLGIVAAVFALGAYLAVQRSSASMSRSTAAVKGNQSDT